MALSDTFQQILVSLPDDWTDLELDLRIFDERRYVDAATLLVTCNAQPYSRYDWHWRLLVAHRFGHAAAAPAVHAALSLLDEAEIEGELAYQERDAREPDAAPVLELDHVSAGPRVREVSFSVARGEIVGLAGLMGSGRTELARVLFEYGEAWKRLPACGLLLTDDAFDTPAWWWFTRSRGIEFRHVGNLAVTRKPVSAAV